MYRLQRFGVVVAVWSVVAFGVVGTASAEDQPAEQPDREAAEDEERFDRLNLEEPDLFARSEVIVGQTIHGLILGQQTCSLLDCEGDERAEAGLTLLGAGAGLGGSLWFTRDGITSGQAAAINSGTVWGAWVGVWSGLLVEEFVSRADRRVLGMVMGGQLAGTGAGVALSEALRPTSGDVAMVNHAGFWTTTYYLGFVLGILEWQSDNDVIDIMQVPVVSLAGGVAGALAAERWPMSRGRVRIISAGGFAGLLTGALGMVMVLDEDVDDYPRATLGSTLIGGAAGLGIATALTRDWDDPEDYPRGSEVSLSVQPAPEGDGALGTVFGRW